MNGKKKGWFRKRAATGGIVTGATVNLDAGDSNSYSGSGTDWFDLTANNYDATLQNGVGYDSGNGGVLTFDYLSDQFVAGHSGYSISTLNPFTVEIWFNTDQIFGGSALFQTLFGIKTNVTNNFRIIIPPSGQTGIWGNLTWGSSSQMVSSKINETISGSTWYQVILTYNGLGATSTSNYSISINNVSKTILTTPNHGVSEQVNRIGVTRYLGADASFLFDGKIPIFNLYPFEFTAEQKTQNYNFYKDRFGL